MDVTIAIAFLTFGIAVLYFGAEALVKGASQLAIGLGISPLVVGLTVVSFATSAPEAVASIMAQVVQGSGDMALGNVLGSNVANIGLILGTTTVICPILVCDKLAGREMGVMLGATLLVTAMLLTGEISRVLAAVLLLGLVAYIFFHVRESRRLAKEMHDKPERPEIGPWVDCLLVAGGTCMLVIGGYALVEGAVGIMEMLGVSERVIGLTIVAAGTSCPELAASVVAAVRGKTEIAIGNVVGSNIFNLLFIVGLAAMIKPLRVDPSFVTTDLPVLLLFSFGLGMMIWVGRRIGRRKGSILLAGYFGYVVYLLHG